MQDIVAHKEDIGPRGLRHLAAIIQHQRIRITGFFRSMLGECADHVEARGLGMTGRGIRGRTAPFGMRQADALHLVGKIIAPRPDSHGEMDRIVLGRNAHHLGTTPGDRPDIGAVET